MTPRFKSVTLKQNPKTIKTKQNRIFNRPKIAIRRETRVEIRNLGELSLEECWDMVGRSNSHFAAGVIASVALY